MHKSGSGESGDGVAFNGEESLLNADEKDVGLLEARFEFGDVIFVGFGFQLIEEVFDLGAQFTDA